MAGDTGSGEVIQALAGHLDDGNNSDVGLSAGQLISTFRRKCKAKIEGLPKSRVVEQPPHQRNRVQVADCANSGPGEVYGVQLSILALAPRSHSLAWSSTNGTWNDLVRVLSSKIRATSRVLPSGES